MVAARVAGNSRLKFAVEVRTWLLAVETLAVAVRIEVWQGTLDSRLRSGREHWTWLLVVEVRHGGRTRGGGRGGGSRD